MEYVATSLPFVLDDNTPLLPRRERERQAKRRAMLDAALAAFADRSFENVTIEEIAYRAEFSKGSLYNYFPEGKQELLLTLFEEVRDDLCTLTETMAGFMRPGGPLRLTSEAYPVTLEAYCTTFIGYFTARPERLALLVRHGHYEVPNGWGERSTLLVELNERLIGCLIPALERAGQGGLPISGSPRIAAGFILGALYAYLFNEGFSPEAVPPTLHTARTPEEAAVMLTSVLLGGLLQPARPKSKKIL